MEAAESVLRIEWLRREADDILSLALADPGGRPLPAWQPGAHLELRLPSGRIRHYSIYGECRDQHLYKIAVKLQKNGSGGSHEIHSSLKAGDPIAVKTAPNRFPLNPAANYVFIAGGIGITPILPMIRAVSLESAWHLYYLGRSRTTMGLWDEIERLPSDHVTVVTTDSSPRLNIENVIAGAKEDTALYACGPNALLDEVQEFCLRRADIALQTERFHGQTAPSEIQRAPDRAFDVVMQRSGKRITIPPGRSILNELLSLDPTVPHSCGQGYCGSCETRVIEGDVDHRDSLLNEDERAKSKSMMICVSRAKGKFLVLDI